MHIKFSAKCSAHDKLLIMSLLSLALLKTEAKCVRTQRNDSFNLESLTDLQWRCYFKNETKSAQCVTRTELEVQDLYIKPSLADF